MRREKNAEWGAAVERRVDERGGWRLYRKVMREGGRPVEHKQLVWKAACWRAV